MNIYIYIYFLNFNIMKTIVILMGCLTVDQAFPRGSPLLASINKALLQVSENGTLLKLEKIMLESEKCTDIETDNESGPPSLTLTSFWVLFTLTIGTSTIALVIYIYLLLINSNLNFMYRQIYIN